MSISIELACAVMIISVIVSRILLERAMRRLSTEEKGRLVEAFSAHRLLSLLPMAGIAALYFAMASTDGLDPTMLLAIYFPAVFVFAVGMQWAVYRKLRTLEIDPAYLRTYTACRVAMLAAFGVFMLAL